MALNAEQIFLDALGREPTADELQDIRLNLWMLTRAGFAVDDPSNAPLIAPWAWMWARLPRPCQPQAAPSAPRPEVTETSQSGIQTIEAVLREIPAKLDLGALAAAITERMPPLIVRHRIDGSALTRTLRESFTLVWVWIATFAIGLSGVLGWHYGALHERSTLAPQIARQIQLSHHTSRVNQTPARPRHRP
jgi:hypothetical protein